MAVQQTEGYGEITIQILFQAQEGDVEAEGEGEAGDQGMSEEEGERGGEGGGIEPEEMGAE